MTGVVGSHDCAAHVAVTCGEGGVHAFEHEQGQQPFTVDVWAGHELHSDPELPNSQLRQRSDIGA